MDASKLTVAIVGASGNMGRRYTAICKFLGLNTHEIDLPNKDDLKTFDFTHAIIATPVPTHRESVDICIDRGITFLCEKPIEYSSACVRRMAEECDRRALHGYMVNNWAHVSRFGLLQKERHLINIDFYNSGNDGAWDYIQPMYYAKDFEHNNTLPIFNCSIDTLPASLDDFCFSYVKMCAAFFSNQRQLLLSIQDSIQAHEKVEAEIALQKAQNDIEKSHGNV